METSCERDGSRPGSAVDRVGKIGRIKKQAAAGAFDGLTVENKSRRKITWLGR